METREIIRDTETPIRKELILGRRRRGVESRDARKRIQPKMGFNGKHTNSIGVANEMSLMYPDTNNLGRLMDYNLVGIGVKMGSHPPTVIRKEDSIELIVSAR